MGKELPCSKLAELMAIFKRHDTNGDRKLSWAEVKVAYIELRSLWPWIVTENEFLHDDHYEDEYIDIKMELEDLVTYSS